MNWNTCNFIKRIEQVLAELDISAIEEYVIIIIINTYETKMTVFHKSQKHVSYPKLL